MARRKSQKIKTSDGRVLHSDCRINNYGPNDRFRLCFEGARGNPAFLGWRFCSRGRHCVPANEFMFNGSDEFKLCARHQSTPAPQGPTTSTPSSSAAVNPGSHSTSTSISASAYGSAPAYGSASAYGPVPAYGPAPIYDSAPIYDLAPFFDHASVYSFTPTPAFTPTTQAVPKGVISGRVSKTTTQNSVRQRQATFAPMTPVSQQPKKKQRKRILGGSQEEKDEKDEEKEDSGYFGYPYPQNRRTPDDDDNDDNPGQGGFAGGGLSNSSIAA